MDELTESSRWTTYRGRKVEELSKADRWVETDTDGQISYIYLQKTEEIEFKVKMFVSLYAIHARYKEMRELLFFEDEKGVNGGHYT